MRKKQLAINIASSATIFTIIGAISLFSMNLPFAVLGLGFGLTYFAMLIKLLKKSR